jgi:hypothetical protein
MKIFSDFSLMKGVCSICLALIASFSNAATTFTLPNATFSGGNALTWLVSTTGAPDNGAPYTIVIPAGIIFTINNANFNLAADLSGSVTVQIQGEGSGGGRMSFQGVNGRITINTGDYISVNPSNLNGLFTNSSYGQIKIDTDGTDYLGHDLAQVIAAGGVSGDGSLPVEWFAFTASFQKEGVLLEWSTASEVDNDYFSIEHSADGRIFEAIGEVDGSGISASVREYNFIHRVSQPGIHYYRVRQVDFNGKSSVTAIRAVEIEGKNSFIQYTANWTSGILAIQLTTDAIEEYVVVLYDLNGRVLSHQKLMQGQIVVNLNLPDFPTGVAVLALISESSKHVKQIVIP